MDLSRILERNDDDPLQGYAREAFEAALAGLLTGRVVEAWFFGSYARNELRPGSDIDLVLIVDTELSFVVRAREFLDLFDLGPRLDVLVYTPGEWRAALHAPSVGFWRELARDRKRLPIPIDL